MKKLLKDEIERIKSFVSKYSDLSHRIDYLENRLSKLDEERIEIMEESQKLYEEINKVRKDEELFQSNLLTKYGEFKLDLETFEIKQS